MCGINACTPAFAAKIAEMNAAIRHRGPDDSGTYSDNLITLGHLRLSIIDLSPAGHQPMWYAKKSGACSEKFHPKLQAQCSTSIVFNGELYNYMELRAVLAKKGYAFTTESDTEVILAAYACWGTACVRKFNGMWAFCIYDKDKRQLFCSRDRLGVKPFYYYAGAQGFACSSELKGILAATGKRTPERLDREALELYFSLGYIPSPWTIYTDIRKLPAHTSLIYDLKKGKVQLRSYFSIPAYKPVHDKAALIRKGKALLYDATRLRMRSDVPVGAFLSGGLDSSAIVGVMSTLTDLKKLHTFSIGFSGAYDESKHIHLVEQHYRTKHHHAYFTERHFKKLLDIIPCIYDEPFGDYSGFPTYAVCSMARQHVTVSLSGDGGDEIFGGYNLHLAGTRLHALARLPRWMRKTGATLPVKKNIEGFASLYLLKEACRVSLEKPEQFFSTALSEDTYKPSTYVRWTERQLRTALKKAGNHLGDALRLFDLEHNTLADNFLVKVDRASMAHALEVRSPFLDYRFIAYSQRIPHEWKTSVWRTKVLMREIIKDIVPAAIVKRKKQGFIPPLEQWILTPKYERELAAGMRLLKKLHPATYVFYNTNVMSRTTRLARAYKIRLFLFTRWWKTWMHDARI